MRGQASSQVSIFGGAQHIFEGARFLVYYMFKTNFSGRNKIWGGTKEIWGALPPNAPRGYGPVRGHPGLNRVLIDHLPNRIGLMIRTIQELQTGTHVGKRVC